MVIVFGFVLLTLGADWLVDGASAKTIAWHVGLGIIADGIGYWVKVAAVEEMSNKKRI